MMADLSLKQKIQTTIRLWTGGKARRTRRNTLLWPQWREEQAAWQLQDLSWLVEQGYDLNAIVYAAVRYRATAASIAPLRAYAGTRDEPEPLPFDHPMARLCDRPNEWMSWSELQESWSTFLALFGDAYGWMPRARATDIPAEIIPLRPDRVTHLYRNQRLAGFYYTPVGLAHDRGTPIVPEDMLHVKLPNPLDPFLGAGKGLSPLYPLQQSLDVDNAASHFLNLLFKNGAMPMGLLSFDGALTPEQAEIAQDRWMETYGGYENWAAPAVMDSGGKYQQIGLSPKDMDLSVIDARTHGLMATVLGVPLTLLLGRPQVTEGTYNNKGEDRRMFWQDSMLPEIRRFEVELRYYLRGESGEFVAYDLSEVPALVEAALEQNKLALEAWRENLLHADEVRGIAGWPHDARGPVYRADTLAAGAVQRPQVPAVPATPGVGGEQPPTSSGDEEGAASSSDEEEPASKAVKARDGPLSTLEQKEAFRKAVDRVAESWESRAAAAAQRALEADRDACLALIHGEKATTYSEKRTVNWQLVLLRVIDYIKASSRASWRDEFAPVIEGVMLEQGQEIATRLGIAFNVRDLRAEAWFDSYLWQFVDPISQTSADALSSMFQHALAAGSSIPDIEDALRRMFAQWIYGGVDPLDAEFGATRYWLYRRENIARTETMRASNAGSWNLYREWGVTKKEWLATSDARTRDTHAEANGQTVGIDEPFIVGGVPMQFPGDPNAPAREVCQCRCAVAPVMED